jgi:hypothetical protein
MADSAALDDQLAVGEPVIIMRSTKALYHYVKILGNAGVWPALQLFAGGVDRFIYPLGVTVNDDAEGAIITGNDLIRAVGGRRSWELLGRPSAALTLSSSDPEARAHLVAHEVSDAGFTAEIVPADVVGIDPSELVFIKAPDYVVGGLIIIRMLPERMKGGPVPFDMEAFLRKCERLGIEI